MTTVAKPHCKNPDHLQVVLGLMMATQMPTATYTASMLCENAVTSWGVVLSKKAGLPLTGLHLLPESVLWLPGELRMVAAAGAVDQTVLILHTFNKVYEHFVTMAISDAFRVATNVENEGKKAA